MVQGGVTIWYRGARYQLGRGQHGYAIWAAGGPPAQPLEWWPETRDGWAAAWARFNAAEVPASIAHLSPPAAPAGRRRAAAALLAAGVACGIAGLFPAYLAGASLASAPEDLVPHAAYLATWAASALLIVAGGPRRRAGSLLGLGLSIVTFGFFFADAGTVISGGAHLLGPGLVLGLIGWLACTAGATLAFLPGTGDGPRRPRVVPAGPALSLAVAGFAALGAAIAFAPSWDSYTLRTPSGLLHYVTAGNAFANPAPVIAGDVAVMIALVVVVITAALWRPARLGAALLAGAVIPMVAQAISALIQVAGPISSSAFGIPPAQAAQAGLTISTGLTPAFWVYCVFVAALLLTAGWLLRPARPRRPAGWAAAAPGSAPPPVMAGRPGPG
jgi:hypothetical protein